MALQLQHFCISFELETFSGFGETKLAIDANLIVNPLASKQL